MSVGVLLISVHCLWFEKSIQRFENNLCEYVIDLSGKWEESVEIYALDKSI